jgi:hypothetical protein
MKVSKFIKVPGPRKNAKPLVAIAVLTRNRPDFLERTIMGLREAMKTSVCDSHLMVWNNGNEPIDWQTHGNGFNVGQHVAMNRMIDEATGKRADYFLRVDEDCEFQTKGWLAKMVHIMERHRQIYKRPCVLSPFVHGLKSPPTTIGDFWMGKWHMQIVPMLGGICRIAPMSLMRYWRWDERMPMGMSEASTFSRYCAQVKVGMLRCVDINVSHGGSTEAQESANPAWAYEHDMLQLVPHGL